MAIQNQNEWREWREAVGKAALERASVLLREWLPAGKLENGRYTVGSLSGEKGRSLTIWLDKGNWKDFGSTGDKGGNLVALYARIRQVPYRTANEELAERFNIPKPTLKRVNHWVPLSTVPDFAPYGEDGLPSLGFTLPGEVAGFWTYLNADGQIIYHRVRLEIDGAKQFRPISFCNNQDTGETGWQVMDQKAPRPLYGLELLAALPEAPVLFVEGEKTADAARELLPDWVVVTAGSSTISAKSTDFAPLLERKSRIVIWPDNDHPGMKMAAEVALALGGDVEIVQPDGTARQGWDLADAKAEGWDTARVLAFLESHAIKAAPESRERVECEISGSDLEIRSRAIFSAVAEVQRTGSPMLFQADGGELALVHQGMRQVADIPHLRQWLTANIRFQGRDKEGNLRPVTPGDTLLENIIVYNGSPLMRLKRLIRRPGFASDRRLILKAGHDTASGIFYVPGRGLEDLTPSDDVDAALELIDDLFCDFAFEAPSDRAHLYAMLLQPAFRELIEGPTPLYRFEAPQPGSGKTLLFETCAALLFEPGWPFITTPSTDDEWGKALLGHLRNGPEVLLIDNAHDLKSYHLAAALTAWPYWSGRLLYQQGSFHVPIRNVWAATMNNPSFSSEMYRRSVRVRITAADHERPETRTGFVHDPILGYVATMKRELSEALLTLAVAAEKTMKPFTRNRLGSFESWVQVMGGVLEAIGVPHFLETPDDYGEDNERAAWAGFIIAWAEDRDLNWQACRPKDLLALAQESDVNLGRGNDSAQVQRLGYMLKRYRDTVVEGYKLKVEGDEKAKIHRYRLFSMGGQKKSENETAESF